MQELDKNTWETSPFYRKGALILSGITLIIASPRAYYILHTTPILHIIYKALPKLMSKFSNTYYSS